jgi:hypothetical protein
MRLVLPFLILLAILSSPFTHAADAKRLTIVDYYLELPDKTFEGPAKDWLAFLKQPDCGTIDVANGYMNCTGDGAQPPFEVALFRFKNDKPLLAVCQGELEGKKSKFLAFYEPGFGGRLHEVKRSLFPIDNEKGYVFELPHKGRSIVVRSEKDNKVKAKYTWNGEKFVEEK